MVKQVRGTRIDSGGSARLRRSRASVAVLAVCGLLASAGAYAQSLATQASSGTAAPTESTVINLINLLVKQGVLTQASASSLIARSECTWPGRRQCTDPAGRRRGAVRAAGRA
jgi:hypothetical protein